MLKLTDLTFWLHQKKLSHLERALVILASEREPVQIRAMKARAREAGFKVPDSWNLSDSLSKSNGLAINDGRGWLLTESGKQHLHNIGVASVSPTAVHVASDLRSATKKIENADTRAFVEEAIRCFEAELYRSAVVMSWLAAVDVLYAFVLKYNLKAFNAEAGRNPKWKPAVTGDDLALMKEREFLDRITAISMIGKNVKTALIECLDRRNGCGHPNSLKIGQQAVAHHIETLILNVFHQFT